MWKWIAAGIAVLLIGTGIYAFHSSAIRLGVNGGACREDAGISDTDRQAIAATAMALVHAVIAKNDAAAYAMMTTRAKSLTSFEQFGDFTAATGRLGPFTNPAVSHLYLLDVAGAGADTRAICGPVSGDDWVSVQVRPGLKQAYADVTAQTINNGWSFTLWLQQENGGWRVADVRASMSGVSGLASRDLLTLARRERDGGHAFNATLLYQAASATTARGPNFQIGVAQSIRKDIAAFTPPPELQGNGPYTWTLQGQTYKVAQVTILGVEKKLALVFILPQDSWGDNLTIDMENRQFLDAFRAAHPDYARVFPFLIARAIKPDNSGGFGTVYDAAKGYQQ